MKSGGIIFQRLPALSDLFSRALPELPSNVEIKNETFASIGGTSIHALVLRNLLLENLFAEIPIQFILQSPSLFELETCVLNACSGKALSNMKVQIDWAREISIPQHFHDMSPVKNDASDVLLTGATGFFGPFLAQAILSRFQHAHLHCNFPFFRFSK